MNSLLVALIFVLILCTLIIAVIIVRCLKERKKNPDIFLSKRRKKVIGLLEVIMYTCILSYSIVAELTAGNTWLSGLKMGLLISAVNTLRPSILVFQLTILTLLYKEKKTKSYSLKDELYPKIEDIEQTENT